ncbi:MAG: DNA endonuclease SmrA [Gammaproteobacteria bacterium]|nr:DNA endonuclease SmrA [Gammaproteobacteria bacterium]
MCDSFKQMLEEDGPVERSPTSNKHPATSGPRKSTQDFAEARNNAEGATLRNYLRDYLDPANRVLPDFVFDWSRDGVQHKVVNRLRHGHYGSDMTIDLHHKSVREAHGLIWDFLNDAVQANCRNVRIVHGKGEKSKPQATMKSYVGQVLQEHDDVFAYCTATPDLGGPGCTMVWLRKSEVAKVENRERHQSRRA